MGVIVGLLAGLIAQFAWKMIYFPEPIIPVIGEITGIIILAGIAIWCIASSNDSK